MASWNVRVWGPHPKHAIGPVLAVLGVLGWLAYKNPQPVETPAATSITVMKPIEGTASAPSLAPIPVEVLYGVPTDSTVHLWPGPHQQSK